MIKAACISRALRKRRRAIIKQFHDQGHTDEQVQKFVNTAAWNLFLQPTRRKRNVVRFTVVCLMIYRKLLDRQDTHYDCYLTNASEFQVKLKLSLVNYGKLTSSGLGGQRYCRKCNAGWLIRMCCGISFLVLLMISGSADGLLSECEENKSIICLWFLDWWDRDGNPYVTPDVTAQTFEWLQEAALETHLNQCEKLGRLALYL